MAEHLNEEQMILHYYRENEDPAATAESTLHLRDCESCAAGFAELSRVLSSINESTVPVPERGSLYGVETWNRVRPRLGLQQQQQQEHISEEEMTLYYYDEAEEGRRGPVPDHLAQCEECRTRFLELKRLLSSIDGNLVAVPERGEFYGREVWNRLRGQLQQTSSEKVVSIADGATPAAGAAAPADRRAARAGRVSNWRNWAAVAAMLVVGVSGYVLGKRSAVTEESGRNAGSGKPLTTAAANARTNDAFEAGRRRVLLVALTDHFERSQMVMAELSNANPGQSGKLDIRYERDEANDLLDSNRLFRQAALQQGDTQAAVLLEDLERMLLEVAHAPDRVGSSEFQDLQRRIQDQGLVFKVKVLTSRLERQNNKL